MVSHVTLYYHCISHGDFDLGKIPEGLYGNMEKIFQFWTLDAYLSL